MLSALRAPWHKLRNARRLRPIRSVVRPVRVRGVVLEIEDFATSSVVEVVPRELAADCYNFELIPFQPRDVVVDVGANVGIASIYLAKKQPELTIHACEPVPENFTHLERNLSRNGVTNVVPHRAAVTADGRSFKMSAHFYSNSGSASGHYANLRSPGFFHYEVPSITLDALFARHQITRCRLLKIDCEGSEHEVLLGCRVLDRVEWLAGEFHLNQGLERAGYSFERLEAHCRRFVAPERIKVSRLRMPD